MTDHPAYIDNWKPDETWTRLGDKAPDPGLVVEVFLHPNLYSSDRYFYLPSVRLETMKAKTCTVWITEDGSESSTSRSDHWRPVITPTSN